MCVCVCAWEEKILSNACCDDIYKLGAAASWYQGLQYQINVFSRSRKSTRNLVENKLNINAPWYYISFSNDTQVFFEYGKGMFCLRSFTY